MVYCLSQSLLKTPSSLTNSASGPRSVSCPDSKTMISSAVANVFNLCDTMIKMLSDATCWITAMDRSSEMLSMADVASSKMMSGLG